MPIHESCDGHSGTVTGFSPSISLSPVSIFPPTLHTHSFTYHPPYIMFLSQHFSFPLSVSFHQRSIPIHSPTTNAVYCFYPSTSVFSCIIRPMPHTHLHLNTTVFRMRKGRSVGTVKQSSVLFLISVEHGAHEHGAHKCRTFT